MDEIAGNQGASNRAARVPGAISMPVLLERTIAALTSLDADLIESLVGQCAAVEPPASMAEWAQAARARRVLTHLLRATGRQLEMLRRVSSHGASFDGRYGRSRGVCFEDAGIEISRLQWPEPGKPDRRD